MMLPPNAMPQISLAGCLFLTLGLLVGCQQQAPQQQSAGQSSSKGTTGSVAVIDLDLVAQELGQDKRISQTLTARQANLQLQLKQLAQGYQQQITQQQQTKAASPEGAVQLASFQREANAKLNEARQQVTRDLATQRSQLIANFRASIKPYAREAARARGLTVIVTNNDSVIYDYVASVDITDDVVKAIAAKTSPAN